MSIVTKTGDSGMTSLYDGQRVPKSHLRILAVGALDEANSILGPLDNSAHATKKLFFELGAVVAEPGSQHSMTKRLVELEEKIEALESKLPPLTQFILPGGSTEACIYFHARAVCRRAEQLMTQIETLPENTLALINRLSDFLFLKAREANLDSDTPEVLWEGKADM